MIRYVKTGLGVIALLVFVYLIKEKKSQTEESMNERKLKQAIKKINIKYLMSNPKYTKTNNGISFDESPMFVDFEGVYFDQRTKTILGYKTNSKKYPSDFIPYSREHEEACNYAYQKYLGKV